MKKLKLSQGYYALIDDINFDNLNQYKWSVSSIKNHKTRYALRYYRIGNKKTSLKMHRAILRIENNDGKLTDHIDGNGLNNQINNLRVCTAGENSRNRGKYKYGSSKFIGVCWSKKRKTFQSQVEKEGKVYWLGYFTKEELAAEAYNKKARELFGDFARLNNLQK